MAENQALSKRGCDQANTNLMCTLTLTGKQYSIFKKISQIFTLQNCANGSKQGTNVRDLLLETIIQYICKSFLEVLKLRL